METSTRRRILLPCSLVAASGLAWVALHKLNILGEEGSRNRGKQPAPV